MRTPTVEYFQATTWWTPNQIRDSFFDYVPWEVTTEFINTSRNLAIAEQARRKSLPAEFVKCPICNGYHGQLNNIDNLCEIHEAATAPLRYDRRHNPV
jgi:hypothetical protein